MSSSTFNPTPKPTIWLARKAQQNRLIAGLAEQGFSVLDFSPLTVTPCTADYVAAQLAKQTCIDGAVFISPSAVDIFHNQIPAGLSSQCRCYGPGAATAAALKAHSYADVEYPRDSYTSEALLALASLQDIVGQNFLIVGGDTGRPLIEEALKARGATVAKIVCYQRLAATDWSAVVDSQFSYVLFSSGQAYRAAAAMVGKPLGKATILVTSARLGAEIRKDGFIGKLLVCSEPSPEALVNLISASDC